MVRVQNPPATTPVSAEEEAYAHLMAEIRSGRMIPGMHIKPEQVAAEIGMSRMPVREAFRRLASEGLLTNRPNRGVVVTSFTADQMEELFEIRSVLEGWAGRLAAQRIRSHDLEELHDLADRMGRARGDLDELVRRHWAFHDYICGLAGRLRLLREIERLHTTVEPYLRLWFANVGTPADIAEQHHQVADVLAGGDPAHAEMILRNHVLETTSEIVGFHRKRLDG
jgi:DNA-binding GntR family transcriptional regulator